MRALTFSLLRALSADHFTSGTTLAVQFGVSRSTISGALKQAGEFGVEIFSLTSKGYRLATPLDFLEVAEVRTALGASARRIDLDVIDQVDSTNAELLRRLATGHRSGTAVAAECQSAGRGRRGRVWHSMPGRSLTFSLLWRFDKGLAQLGGLSLVVGLAVVRALASISIEARLKWPNDIWIAQKKCGGILIETRGELMGPVTAVIGIGLNVDLPDALMNSIDQPVTDLASHRQRPISRSPLLGKILLELIDTLDAFALHGFEKMREQWIGAHALHQQQIEIHATDGAMSIGKVVGVTAIGALVVMVDGAERFLSSEEISLRPHGAPR